ncbi:hypothetical protein [Lignipirellula cremea]|uniref:Uncharacterized protein n=1 Tax=Lignipirellula cremea TaxID=2528010 RepID=A0A518DN96_9BACT|nr:hypothetical protein [Lignipirellula cremea]QDU93301.1 hypothetical protein Pla8534_10810 [Lignipirellula cremea]
MTDLKLPAAIWAKGILFLLLGGVASLLLLLQHPELRTALLLGIAVWAFCRFYYFAFYVIEHYVDPQFRFAGLFDFARYAWRQARQPKQDEPRDPP